MKSTGVAITGLAKGWKQERLEVHLDSAALTFEDGADTGEIVVRRARAGERLRTLDGTDRALDADDLLITDDSGPIGIAGVMGGESTEVSAATTNIVLEAATFHSISVARSARRHVLRGPRGVLRPEHGRGRLGRAGRSPVAVSG